MRVPENDLNIRITKDIFGINLKSEMIVLYNINQLERNYIFTIANFIKRIGK